ncbi:MAG: glycosyltransferase family 4 protein [Pyrobaculum sp.]
MRYAIHHELYHHQNPIRAIGVLPLYPLFKYTSRLLNYVDRIICVSRRQAEIFTQYNPTIKDSINVIYNPLPPELIHRKIEKVPDEIPTFLYVGGDSYIKGFHVLLQAINQIGKRGIRAKFMLIGKYGRDALNAIKHLEAKYPTIEIKVFGRTSHSEVMKLHRITWALTFPSISEEPLPYAVVEAVALGTIPIASRVGGVPEIVGKDGVRYLFSPQNVEEFTSKIAKVIMLHPSNVVKIGFFLRKNLLTKLSKETNDITKVFS